MRTQPPPATAAATHRHHFASSAVPSAPERHLGFEAEEVRVEAQPSIRHVHSPVHDHLVVPRARKVWGSPIPIRRVTPTNQHEGVTPTNQHGGGANQSVRGAKGRGVVRWGWGRRRRRGRRGGEAAQAYERTQQESADTEKQATKVRRIVTLGAREAAIEQTCKQAIYRITNR